MNIYRRHKDLHLNAFLTQNKKDVPRYSMTITVDNSIIIHCLSVYFLFIDTININYKNSSTIGGVD